MSVGVILLIVGLFLVFLMREAPTAAGIALIPLSAPGIIWIAVDSFGMINMSTQENIFLLVASLFVLNAVYFYLKYILKRFFIKSDEK